MSTTQTVKLQLRFLVKENQEEEAEEYKQEHRLTVINMTDCLPLIHDSILEFIWHTERDGLEIIVKEISLFQNANTPGRANPRIFSWLMNNKVMPVYDQELFQTFFHCWNLELKIYK